jgi:hypothetical protein
MQGWPPSRVGSREIRSKFIVSVLSKPFYQGQPIEWIAWAPSGRFGVWAGLFIFARGNVFLFREAKLNANQTTETVFQLPMPGNRRLAAILGIDIEVVLFTVALQVATRTGQFY